MIGKIIRHRGSLAIFIGVSIASLVQFALVNKDKSIENPQPLKTSHINSQSHQSQFNNLDEGSEKPSPQQYPDENDSYEVITTQPTISLPESNPLPTNNPYLLEEIPPEAVATYTANVTELVDLSQRMEDGTATAEDKLRYYQLGREMINHQIEALNYITTSTAKEVADYEKEIYADWDQKLEQELMFSNNHLTHQQSLLTSDTQE